jgi:hypothetical protein
VPVREVVCDERRPRVVEVPVAFPRAATDLDKIGQSFPDLQKKLASRWPVRDIAVTCRNPFNPSQLEITVVIGLITWVTKPLANKLRDEVYRWLECRFRGAKKWTRGSTRKRRRERKPALPL